MSSRTRGTNAPVTLGGYGGRGAKWHPQNRGMAAAVAAAQAGGMTTTHEAPAGAAQDVVTPDRIFEIAQGFMASKHLFAASELGVFEALGEGPVDLDGLAARTGLTRRTARISADAMVAIGLLERHGDRYANSPVAATFLSGATPADLRPLLRFWDRLSYPAWADLAGALGRGRPAHEIFEIDDELVPVMSAGIAAATAAACHALPKWPGCRRRAGCWTSAAAPVPGRSPWRQPTRLSPRPCSSSAGVARVAQRAPAHYGVRRPHRRPRR